MEKKELMNKIERYEKVYLDLVQTENVKNLSSSTLNLLGEIEDEEQREKMLQVLDDLISVAKTQKKADDGKLYLSEIVEKEKPDFGLNNLILSPVGSGKTYFSKKLIGENETVLYLVSTTSLKDSLVPEDDQARKLLGNRMYTSQIKGPVYGEGTYKIHVMTYAELGKRIEYVDTFAKKFDKIFCDEIHSLPLYRSYNSSDTLLVVIRYLFSKHDNQYKFYFTATDEHIKALMEESKELFEETKVFNYLEHPNIKRYMPLSKYKITGIEQVRSHLRARSESFRYFGYKIFAFCKTIESQKRLKKICEEEGFTAEIYWSMNNEEKKMSDRQIEEMNQILTTGKLPNEYDVVIINSAYQEGWNLVDERVKLAIMNTTNETEHIQALGRIRKDIDILIYRVNPDAQPDHYLDFPKNLIGEPLTKAHKDKLCERFGLYNNRNDLAKWPTIKKVLENQGFIIKDTTKSIDGKRTRVSIVEVY